MLAVTCLQLWATFWSQKVQVYLPTLLCSASRKQPNSVWNNAK